LEPSILSKQGLGLVKGCLTLSTGFLKALLILRRLPVKGGDELLLLRVGTL
jgi:hypothetical protein